MDWIHPHKHHCWGVDAPEAFSWRFQAAVLHLPLRLLIGNNPELAFSPDGIDEMNRNIVALNRGKFHYPIYKIRRFERGNKFAIGQTGNKTTKYVEADKGTNLFFAVFGIEKLNKETGETESVRSYLTIPLNVMIGCQKRYGSKWRVEIESFLKEMELVSVDATLLFILSPNDLVSLNFLLNSLKYPRKSDLSLHDGSTEDTHESFLTNFPQA